MNPIWFWRRLPPHRSSVILVGLLCLIALLWRHTTTSAQAGKLSFGLGGAVAFVDPDGRNGVPIWVTSPAAPVDFTLYSLSPSGIIDRYQRQPPWTEPTIDVSGLAVVAGWQQSFSDANPDTMRPALLPTTTVPSGLYVLEATDPTLGQAQTLLVVSRTVLVLKRSSSGQLTVWASTLQSGAPAPGMTVTAYNAQANVLAIGVTDENGIASLNAFVDEPVMVLGEGRGEITLAGLDWTWRANESVDNWSLSESPAYRIYLHTERPLYRPGDTIQYNAILRSQRSTGYGAVAPSEPISLTLRDARQNLVATQVKQVDEFGALAGEFLLASEAPLGEYQLALSIAGQLQTQVLYVEEYRKPEYEVTVNTPVAELIAGDAIEVTVAADYFFGQPVANAAVKLQIYRAEQYGGHYPWVGDPTQAAPTTLVTELTGQTDSTGRWRTTYTPAATSQTDAAYRFQAAVTDARQLPVEGEQTVNVYWNAYALAISTGRYGYGSGDPIIAQVVTRNHDETPLAGQVVTVRVVREEWPADTQVDVIPPQQVTTAADGQVAVALGTLPQGWYKLIASGVDKRNRTVAASHYLWVYEQNGLDWWFTSNDQITISADQTSYKAGETATLLIQSRVQGVALLTLERAGVYQERIVQLARPITAVTLPITADFAPNLYAKVHLFEPNTPTVDGRNAEARLLVAATELLVPATEKQLTVVVTPDSATYGPGQLASLTVKVTDHAGQPQRARVSLALVDEALFALQPDLSADLFATFYGRQANGVLTYHSLAREPFYYEVVEAPPDTTGTPAPVTTIDRSAPDQVNTRRLFLDTAYWNPALITGDDGVATVALTLPDNLTTWRIIVRAVTVETLVGAAQQALLVTQPVIARPALPRFAVLGDRFRSGIVAQNFSGAGATGEANLAVAGLVILDAGPRGVSLANGGSATANWTTVAADPGPALVTATLTTGAGQDRVALPLPILPFSVPERWTTAGQVGLTATASFTVPLHAVNEASQLRIHLAGSLALGLLDGLDTLIDYPYGCVEQTMSRLLPTAVAAHAYQQLGLPNPKAEELPEIMSQGLQRLYGFQHTGGSWGWFYDDAGGAYTTAYVLLGLTAVQEAGFIVDAQVLAKGFAYLDSVLDAIQEPGVKAFALYVKAAAGRGNVSQAQALVAQADRLDAAGLAALTLALELDGDRGNAQSMLDKLLRLGQETASWVSWPLANDEWGWVHWQAMSSTEKNTAFALRALLALRPDHPLAAKAVRWLMDHRNGAGWGGYGSANTQATAYAVLGLADYIRLAGELTPSYSYTVLLNGAPLSTGQVTPATAQQPIPALVVAGDELRTGVNELHIERTTGPGQLYYSVQLDQQLFFDGFEPVTSLDQGLALTRSYKLIEGQPRGDGAYNVGDLVEVTLHLTAGEQMSYVLVEDPLPAGFEALSERVNPQRWGDCFGCLALDQPFWTEWGYNRKEVHDERVDFFITELHAGEHTYTYLMRAVAPGEFSVLPGQAYPMYHEEIWGRSASARVMVTPEALTARPTLAGDFDRNCQISGFDVRQVAPFYGAYAGARNLIDDERITLQDVLAVAGRIGSRCGADQPLPGASNETSGLLLTTNISQTHVGEPVVTELRFAPLNSAAGSAATVGSFGLTLRYDPAKLAFATVSWHPDLGAITPLGPTTDPLQGLTSLGALDVPRDWPAGKVVATIAFATLGVGHTTVALAATEAADGSGRLVHASGQSDVQVLVSGYTLLLPLVER